MAADTKKEISKIIMRRLLPFFVSTLVSLSSFGQDAQKDKIRELEAQREFQKTRQVNARLDSAIQFLNSGQYEEADVRFRYVLANMKSVPSDVAYYFGKNSYNLEKYKQSVDWLTKYVQLKGTTGQYSVDAAAWLKKAEDALVQQRLAQSAKAQEVLSRDFMLDCGPAGKVVCPVCNGSTVVIRKTYFGEKYATCGYCNKHGYLTCDEYNQLIRGQLKVTDNK